MFQAIAGHESDSQNPGDFWQFLVNGFHTAHPEITINLNRLAWGDMDTKTSVAVAANQPPDVYFDVNSRIYKFYKQGAFRTLDGIYSSNELKDFWPAAVTNASDPKTGKLFMSPTIFISDARMGLVEDIWASKGLLNLLPPSGGTWTLDQFQTAIAAINSPPNVYALCTEMANEQGMNQLDLTHNLGATVFTADDQKIDPGKKDLYAQTMNILLGYYKQGYFAPQPQALKGGDCNPLYLKKKVAVFWQPQADIVAQAQKNGVLPYTVRYVMLPTNSGQQPTIPGADVGFAVSKNLDASKRDAAYTFVRWLSTADNMNLYKTSSYAAGWLYPRYSVPTSGYFGAGPFLEGLLQEQTNKNFKPTTGLGLFNPAWSQVRYCEFPEWQAAFNGSKSVQAATDAFYTCATNAVANAG